MHKRLIGILLLISMMAGMLSTVAYARDDDPLYMGDGRVDHTDEVEEDQLVDPDRIDYEDLRISRDCVEFIKDQEGFIPSAKWDVAQYSIGYGCSTAYAEKYGFSTTNLSEEEGDQLLLCVLAEQEVKLDEFLEKHDLDMEQHEYDALMSFTFNVGTGWLTKNYRITNLLVEGDYTDNELASAMGVWCHVGTEIDNILLNRRILEIKMFLYGAYEKTDTYLFCVLFYDGNGGKASTDIGFYLEGEPYGSLFTASHEEDEEFLGWYTRDGEQITEDDIVEDDLTVYAQWGEYREVTDIEDEDPEDETVFVEDPLGNGETEPEAEPEEEELPDLTQIFSDVSGPEQWYYEELAELYKAGVINGYPDGTFRPASTVTTGEALKMILEASGYPTPERVASHWARGYLNLALEEELLVRGEITDLDIPMTRELVCRVASKALRLERMYEDQPFDDTDSTYVLALYDHGVITGYEDGSFRPEMSLTRAELTAIVWRILEYFG